jgi:hypothetical protein
LNPGWERIRESAIDAAKDKQTWIPLLGSAVFAIDDLDEETLEWATEHNPIFGNSDNAKDWSDGLADAALVSWLSTGMAVPSGQTGPRPRRLVMQGLVISTTQSVTTELKSTFNRRRPDRPSKRNSFPSSHTSGATVAATLAARNMEYLGFSDANKNRWKRGFYGLAGLTGWARVEGNRHYPSDVLFGYALGHFMGSFLNHAFVKPQSRRKVQFDATVFPDGGFVLHTQIGL